MSVLVILLPARPRSAAGAGAAVDYAYVISSDGGASVGQQGRAPLGQMPRADSVCALLPDADVSWLRLQALPKAPAARLRAALGGLLEDELLSDDEDLHLALAPDASAGLPAWVSVTDRAWFAARLAELEAAGLAPQRVMPASWPAPAADSAAADAGVVRVHVQPAAEGDDNDEPTLVWSDDSGVQSLRLAGGLARHKLEGSDRSRLQVSAHPAAVAAAERWSEGPVTVLGDAERALAALRSGWNLRQFEFAPRHRGLQALRLGLQQFARPEWRPLRWGLAALVLVQLIGLNVWAWRLDRSLDDKRQAMVRVLQTSHPQVRAVLDAPLQMKRETDDLRTAAGRPGPGDLETLLSVAAAAWPQGFPPLQALRFEPGRLSLTAIGWDDTQHSAFDAQVRAAGYLAQREGPQVVLTPGGRS